MTDCAIDCSTLQTRLAEAEAAYHSLLTGGGRQSVTFGAGKSVTYTAANIAELRRYINDLKDELAKCCGTTTAAKPRAPVRFAF